MERKEKAQTAASGPRTLLWEGEPVLTFEPPRVGLPAETPRRVERYYRRLEAAWLGRWEGELHRRACAAAREARERSRPFEPWSAGLTAEAEGEEGVLLVRWAAEERTGGRSCVLSRTDRWQLPGGTPVSPPERHGKKAGRKK